MIAPISLLKNPAIGRMDLRASPPFTAGEESAPPAAVGIELENSQVNSPCEDERAQVSLWGKDEVERVFFQGG